MILPNNRIKEIIDAFEGMTILVIGDIMVDEYLSGKVTRISPEAPVPIVEIDKEFIRFGGAANVALNIKNLGCIPVLIGILGDDAAGKSFHSLLKKENIGSNGILKSSGRSTTIKTRIIGDSQHIARVDKESREYASEKEEKAIIDIISANINKAQAVILQDYNKGVLSKRIIEYTIQLCRDKNIPVAVDPKFLNFNTYRGVTFFKPNLKEVQQALARSLTHTSSIEEAGYELLKQMDAESVLLTLGAQGMSLFEKNKKVTHIPTLARNVADVSGAGDTVIATLTAAYIGGASKLESAALANLAAGIVVEEVGIVPISRIKLVK